MLDSFAIAINKNALDSVIIEGHTDSIGTLEYNNTLSKERALSVGSYLSGKIPFREGQLLLRHFAFTRPLVSNQTENGRQQNRRVEIYIYRRERSRN